MNISINKYAKALAESLNRNEETGSLDSKISNFLSIIKKKKKRKLLKRFNGAFENAWSLKHDEIVVRAVLPFESTEEEDNQLKNLLKEVLGKEIVLHKIVDKKIIGGMRLEFDDKIIDLTVKNNLEILKNKFSAN